MGKRMWLDLQKFADEGGEEQIADGSAAAEETAAQEPAAEETTEAAEEGREQEFSSFRDIIHDPRYKDEYNAHVERTVKRRLSAQERKLRSDMQPMMAALARHYGMDPESDFEAVKKTVLEDDSLLEEAAAEAGMTVDGYRRVAEAEARLQQSEEERREEENRQRWMQIVEESDRLGKAHDGFSLEESMQDERFRAMVVSLQANGVANPVEAAYYATNYKKLVANEVRKNAELQRQQIANDIQSGQRRPAENGTAHASATHKIDPSNLTKEQRADIMARLARGEKIHFGA
ncbi:MAG: hypothetical protein KBS74_02215 [Clostridiales bacterium]|nr:hypothetical protein [Candidatus Cacconaster stercorequi]